MLGLFIYIHILLKMFVTLSKVKMHRCSLLGSMATLVGRTCCGGSTALVDDCCCWRKGFAELSGIPCWCDDDEGAFRWARGMPGGRSVFRPPFPPPWLALVEFARRTCGGLGGAPTPIRSSAPFRTFAAAAASLPEETKIHDKIIHSK